jgi:hypothetical protein
MAGFGLSAFFFTTLSNTLLGSTTSTFLLILAFGTSCLMLLGFLFVRPVPFPEQASSQSLEDGDDVQDPALLPALQHHNHCRTPLLKDNSINDRYVRTAVTTDGEHSNSVMEAIRSVQVSGQKHSTPLNIYGKALLSNFEFWLLTVICSMRMFPSGFFFLLISYTRTVVGIGYTCMSRIFLKNLYWDYYTFFDLDINNVGSMSRSLYAHNNSEYDEAQALRWQAAQVSVISLTNFGGRFFIGTADSISLPFFLTFSLNRLLFGLY